MSDPSKINQELLNENDALKRKIEELEQSLKEHRQAEEKLKESETLFREIADCSPDLEHWMGPDGKFRWISPNAFEFTGYTVEECLKMDGYPVFNPCRRRRSGKNRTIIYRSHAGIRRRQR